MKKSKGGLKNVRDSYNELVTVSISLMFSIFIVLYIFSRLIQIIFGQNIMISDVRSENMRLKSDIYNMRVFIEHLLYEVDRLDTELDEIYQELNMRRDLSRRTNLTIVEINHILEACEKYNVPVPMFLSLLEVESRFRADAVNSSSGATGIAQFMPSTARWLADRKGIRYKYEHLKDFRYSVSLACYYLHYLNSLYKNWSLVLSHYGGYGLGGEHSYFVRNILAGAKKYEEIMTSSN